MRLTTNKLLPIPYLGAISSLEGWGSKACVQDLDAGARGDLSPLPHPQEREVSSAALETAQIKDKLKKRRMSEGLLAPLRGKAGASPLFSRRQGLSQPRELVHITTEQIAPVCTLCNNLPCSISQAALSLLQGHTCVLTAWCTRFPRNLSNIISSSRCFVFEMLLLWHCVSLFCRPDWKQWPEGGCPEACNF